MNKNGLHDLSNSCFSCWCLIRKFHQILMNGLWGKLISVRIQLKWAQKTLLWQFLFSFPWDWQHPCAHQLWNRPSSAIRHHLFLNIQWLYFYSYTIYTFMYATKNGGTLIHSHLSNTLHYGGWYHTIALWFVHRTWLQGFKYHLLQELQR